MSDNFIILIPVDPLFVPRHDLLHHARAMLEELLPNSDRITFTLRDQIQFIDCGENFERVSCPNCGSAIPTDWWQKRMDADFIQGGFVLTKHLAPCCHSKVHLNELQYEFPQGFAKLSIEIMNPGKEESVDHIQSVLERLLETGLRIIHRRI